MAITDDSLVDFDVFDEKDHLLMDALWKLLERKGLSGQGWFLLSAKIRLADGGGTFYLAEPSLLKLAAQQAPTQVPVITTTAERS